MAPRVKNREPDGKLGKDIELSIQGSLFLLLVRAGIFLFFLMVPVPVVSLGTGGP